MRWLFTLFAAVGLAHAAYPNPLPVNGSTNAHDPTMCKDRTGKYFIFSTAPGIDIRTSRDRKNWKFEGKVFPNGSATWTDEYTLTTDGNIWAPQCTIIGRTFYLYYSASSFGNQTSAIFLAKSKIGLPGTFTHEGLVTASSAAVDYNAIDPTLIIDHHGKWYLSIGSFWTGIKLLALNPRTGKPYNDQVIAIASRIEPPNAIEGSVIHRTGKYYYLYTSWDGCCAGVNSTYNIHVGRSLSATGPFKDAVGLDLTNRGGTQLLAAHDGIVGPGGQDIMDDVDGTLMIYHYYTAEGFFLGINKLDFRSGWPVVV